MMDIDLNLRRVFETLYDERNVTRVAARLFLTQSAFSHALARDRDVLGDRRLRSMFFMNRTNDLPDIYALASLSRAL
jgi:hypothetical protein